MWNNRIPFRGMPGDKQLSCYLTHTNPKTHEIIADHLHESAMYGGMIEGTGVRYCPSIEDKIVKFSVETLTMFSLNRKEGIISTLS